jgi:replication factor A1
MAVSLTEGVVMKMLNGEVTSETDMMPVLQVTELKLIQSKLHQNQESSNRYKFLLSDGTDLAAGMLNTSLNSLVNQGTIQLGSVIRLTHYICNLIQTRR